MYVIIDVRPDVEHIPTTAYVTAEEVEADGKDIQKTFKHLASSVGESGCCCCSCCCCCCCCVVAVVIFVVFRCGDGDEEWVAVGSAVLMVTSRLWVVLRLSGGVGYVYTGKKKKKQHTSCVPPTLPMHLSFAADRPIQAQNESRVVPAGDWRRGEPPIFLIKLFPQG